MNLRLFNIKYVFYGVICAFLGYNEPVRAIDSNRELVSDSISIRDPLPSAPAVASSGKVYFSLPDGKVYSCSKESLYLNLGSSENFVSSILHGNFKNTGKTPETAIELDVDPKLFRKYILNLFRFGEVAIKDCADAFNTANILDYLSISVVSKPVIETVARSGPEKFAFQRSGALVFQIVTSNEVVSELDTVTTTSGAQFTKFVFPATSPTSKAEEGWRAPNGSIWFHPNAKKMSRRKALRFCLQRQAELPSDEDFKDLRNYFGYDSEAGYFPESKLFPKLFGNTFWTSNSANYFSGTDGSIHHGSNSKHEVMCVSHR